MPNPFNDKIIDEFRANNGRVGGPFEGGRLILLTTIGARSGAEHTTPLAYLPDGGDRILVIGSAGGAPKNPDWYHNVLTNPRVRVENGVFTYDATASVLEGAERETVFARAAEANPGWADYQARTSRVIPVVALTAVPSGPPAMTMQGIHDAFRRELALIRKEVAESGPGIGAQLRINCLTLCKGLDIHHRGEDAALFPILGDRHPDLAPALTRMRAEHEKLAALLELLQRALAADEPVLAQIDQLIDDLEAHLTYEEEVLLPLL